MKKRPTATARFGPAGVASSVSQNFPVRHKTCLPQPRTAMQLVSTAPPDAKQPKVACTAPSITSPVETWMYLDADSNAPTTEP